MNVLIYCATKPIEISSKIYFEYNKKEENINVCCNVSQIANWRH